MLTLRKQHSPLVRYEVCLDHQTLFTVSKTTLKVFLSYDCFSRLLKLHTEGEIPLSLPLEALRDHERKQLATEARFYLAKNERSPYHFQQWLKKRGVPQAWYHEFTEQFITEKFLSSERFAQNFVEHRKHYAKKPWQKVHLELSQHLIPKEIIATHAYEDLDILKKKYLADPTQHEPKKLTETLIRQGFPHHCIKKLTEAIAEAILETAPTDLAEDSRLY